MPSVLTAAGSLALGAETFRLACLPAGARLWHGTACAGDLARLDAPAWFCTDIAGAARWAGWRNPPPGCTPGPRIVVEYEARRDLWLIAFDDCQEFYRLSTVATGRPMVWRRQVAIALRESGLPGWIGNEEVMLTSTAGLRLVGVTGIEEEDDGR